MNRLLLKRIFIETTSPLAVHSGDREVGFDTQVCRDWNDLPYIPATSITGTWRAVILDLADTDIQVNKWFGTLGGNAQHASRITVSDALLLDDESALSSDKLLLDSDKNEDKIYSIDISFNRDRCRITHRGTAANRGKFDVAVIPSGTRFSFDISVLVNNDEEVAQFE